MSKRRSTAPPSKRSRASRRRRQAGAPPPSRRFRPGADWIAGWSARRLGLLVFLLVAGGRLAANLALALAHGRYASPNPEIWFYLGIAERLDPSLYHLVAWDPTVWILRPLGWLCSEPQLYVAILVAGSLSMAAASAALALAAQRLARSAAAGLAAGLLYAVTPWTYGASLGGFTHDTVGLALAAAALWATAVALDPTPGGGGRGRAVAGAGLVLLLLGGLVIGPTALAILGVAVVGLLVRALARGRWARTAVGVAGCLALGVTLLLLTDAARHPDMQESWVGWVWERLAAAAAARRGLDIVLQSQQGSADVLPGRPLDLFHTYPAALWVAALAGAAAAWRRHRLEPLLLLAIGALGFCVGQRGIRIVELGLAWSAGLALADRDALRRLGTALPAGRGALAGSALLATAALAATVWRPPASPGMLVGGLLLAAALALAGSARLAAVRDALVVLAVVALALTAQRGIGAVVAVGNAHVELLRSVRAVAPASPGEQILPASWDLGYMVGVVSGRRPAAHPQAINAARDRAGENDARIFWSPEAAGAAEARRRGIRFVYLGDRDFSILEELAAQDRFRMRRRMGFQVPTMSRGGQRGPLPLSIVRQLTIYRMVREPERLSAWQLLAEGRDPHSGEVLRVFELVDAPALDRSYVFAILDNPSPVVQESEVQLFQETAGGEPGKRGARLVTRVPPNRSAMSIFSFAGVAGGRGRVELSNQRVEVRMIARQAGGHYTVDMARPRDGWQPIALP